MNQEQKDATGPVRIRFKVPENKLDAFTQMYTKITGINFEDSLVGASMDTGKFVLTCELTISEDHTVAQMRTLVQQMNMLHLRLSDFMPCFSEAPLEIHREAVPSLLAILRAQRQNGKPTPTPTPMNAVGHKVPQKL